MFLYDFIFRVFTCFNSKLVFYAQSTITVISGRYVSTVWITCSREFLFVCCCCFLFVSLFVLGKDFFFFLFCCTALFVVVVFCFCFYLVVLIFALLIMQSTPF